jgi:hypothetical protein
MKQSITKWIMFFLALIILAFVCSTQLNCMSAPEREDYTSIECFLSADCLYRNKDNEDKSACSELTKDCVYRNKEKRIKARLEYCEDNKFQGMTKNECRLFLNQK